MVRFIIYINFIYIENSLAIYIPIWLDLLQEQNTEDEGLQIYLHSNMVRFIIFLTLIYFSVLFIIYIPIWLDLLYGAVHFTDPVPVRFTFQYGQIYYAQAQVMSSGSSGDLHSNMVRFIIPNGIGYCKASFEFTFQYGQIYYDYAFIFYLYYIAIYIPIWLDLLCICSL